MGPWGRACVSGVGGVGVGGSWFGGPQPSLPCTTGDQEEGGSFSPSLPGPACRDLQRMDFLILSIRATEHTGDRGDSQAWCWPDDGTVIHNHQLWRQQGTAGKSQHV